MSNYPTELPHSASKCFELEWIRVTIREGNLQGIIHIHLEILTANTLSEVALVPQAPTSLNGGALVGIVPSTTASAPSGGENLAIQCYDKDKHGWTLEVSPLFYKPQGRTDLWTVVGLILVKLPEREDEMDESGWMAIISQKH